MKNIKAPKLVTIAILSMITIMFWVAFEVFRTFTKAPDLSIPKEVTEPLNPTLDQNALSKLQGRMFIEEGTIGQTVLATPVPIPTPQPSPSPTESPAATQSASPSATESASPTPGGTI